MTGEGGGGPREEIELAWHRAELSGLNPGMEVKERPAADFDPRSGLLIASEPVLDRMVDELTDTRFSVLLADNRSRIVDRRVRDGKVSQALDRVLAVPGFQYSEEVSGTNSLATAFELRKPIAVTGAEHYLEALQYFCCYGAPIIHPVTHRLEGVLDVSGPVDDATNLLGPFLMRAVRDIELRLLEGSRLAEKHLLAEFQAHASRQRHAVVALGENLVLTNSEAVDLVKGIDHVALRMIAAELDTRNAYEDSLTLDSGREVHVRARRVAGTRGGTLFDITRTERIASRSAGPRASSTSTTGSAPSAQSVEPLTTLVTGEPGTGKTTAAQKMAGRDPVCIDAVDSFDDERAWLARCREALSTHPVVIDNIDLLDAPTARRVAALLGRPRTSPVVLTSLPVDELGDSHRVLASMALTRHDLQPVRTYPHRLPAVIRSILGDVVPGSTVEIAPSTLQLLAAQPWPGNLRELRSVLTFAARDRETGVIIDGDLPPALCATATPRRLTRMESVERDAIVAALRECGGNKAAAAAQLGIGRTTLYSRLRRFRISVPEENSRRRPS